MKTKILLITALAAAIVYSCSSEREEQNENPTSENKLDLSKLKTSNNQGETSKSGDTIVVKSQLDATSGSGIDPVINPDPNEGGDPTTITPPKR